MNDINVYQDDLGGPWVAETRIGESGVLTTGETREEAVEKVRSVLAENQIKLNQVNKPQTAYEIQGEKCIALREELEREHKIWKNWPMEDENHEG